MFPDIISIFLHWDFMSYINGCMDEIKRKIND